MKYIDRDSNVAVTILQSKQADFEEYVLVEEEVGGYTYWCDRDSILEVSSDDAADASVEYCVMHKNYPTEPHRVFGTSLDLAQEWIRETEEEDGILEGMFYVAQRAVGCWEKV